MGERESSQAHPYGTTEKHCRDKHRIEAAALGEKVSLEQLSGVFIIVTAAVLTISARGRRPSEA